MEQPLFCQMHVEIKDYGTRKGTVFDAQKARPMRPIEVTKVESRNYFFGSSLDLKFLDFSTCHTRTVGKAQETEK